jgi:FG-GAP-like repeat
VGDYNHDGKQDLVFLVAGVLHVWFGNGNGTFTSGLATAVNNIGMVAVGVDFDGDGIADVALTDGVTPTVVSILYGDNTGHFLKTTNVTIGRGAYSLGDVNSDGRTDIVVVPFTTASTKYIGVYYGNVARTFVNHTTISTAHCPSGQQVSVADLDGNGINDLLVPETTCGSSSPQAFYLDVRTRNPDSSYNADQTIYTAPTINGTTYQIPNSWIVRADANTKPDVLLTQCLDDHCETNQSTVLLNTTSGNFHSCFAPPTSQGINICAPAVLPLRHP